MKATKKSLKEYDEIVKTLTKRKVNPVIIYWEDITSYHNWQNLSHNFSTIKPFTIGFLIKENKEYYWVCQTWCEDDVVGDVIMIPKGNVRVLKYFTSRNL